MTAVNLRAFAGQNSKIAPHLLDQTNAQRAENCLFSSGEIEPLKGLEDQATLAWAIPGQLKSIYRFAGQFWFGWTTHVNAVPGPIAGDTESRTYFTGDGVPKMTYAGIATASGDGHYPSAAYDLGLPAPASGCVAALQGAPDDDTALAQTRFYTYTFVSALGEEGPPAPVSNSVDWRPGQTVNLTGLVGAPTGNFNVAQKFIYRTDEDERFRFVGAIALGTSFTDTVADTALGEELPSTDWIQPPSDMQGLIGLPNGSLAGFSGNTLCFSQPYQPYAWPLAYRFALDYAIQGIGAFGQSIAVLTSGHPYVVSGTDPRAMSVDKIEVPYPCLSAESVVDVGYAVVYASSDGLIAISGSGAKNLTGNVLSREQWEALNPDTIRGFRWKDNYIAVHSGGAFIIDSAGDEFSELDVGEIVMGGTNDPATGNLYLIYSNKIAQFGAGALLTSTWKSKEFRTPRPINFACAKVEGSGSVNVKIYADGVEKFNNVVSLDKLFHLPGGFLASRWVVDLTGHVSQFQMAESSSELRSV